ncbi:MAG TPA: hypothetical protein PLJ44_10980, partial [Victivallales bacterium]|nr:hypothetical protein [Victivallales bacterium]
MRERHSVDGIFIDSDSDGGEYLILLRIARKYHIPIDRLVVDERIQDMKIARQIRLERGMGSFLGDGFSHVQIAH